MNATKSENITKFLNGIGTYSTLVSSLHLRRRMGYFILQVYAPCMLLTAISWVPLWINREATSDRIMLGKDLRKEDIYMEKVRQHMIEAKSAILDV